MEAVEYLEEGVNNFVYAKGRQIDGDHGRAIILRAISPEDTPLTAQVKILLHYREISLCHSPEKESWLDEMNANKVRFIVKPVIETSQLQISPYIQMTFDKVDGLWDCGPELFTPMFGVFDTWADLPQMSRQ